MKVILLLLTLIILVAIIQQNAYANVCPPLDVETYYLSNQIVFVGKVIDNQSWTENSNNHEILNEEYVLEIRELLKGNSNDKITLSTKFDSDASYALDLNQTYLIFAYVRDNDVNTYNCNVWPLPQYDGELESLRQYIKTQSNILSPKEQIRNGIDPKSVECKWNLHPIIKSNRNFTACVNFHTLSKLVSHGWAGVDNVSVKVYTNKSEYRIGEEIAIFMKNDGFIPIKFPQIPSLSVHDQNDKKITEWIPRSDGSALIPSSRGSISPGEEVVLYIWDQKPPLFDIPWNQTFLKYRAMEEFHTEEYHVSDYGKNLNPHRDFVYYLESFPREYYKIPQGEQVKTGEYYFKINYETDVNLKGHTWADTIVYPITITQ